MLENSICRAETDSKLIFLLFLFRLLQIVLYVKGLESHKITIGCFSRDVLISTRHVTAR